MREGEGTARWIDKAGGLDEYLLKTPDRKIASEMGLKLKARVRQALEKRRAAGETELYKLKMARDPPRVKPRQSSPDDVAPSRP